MMEQFKDVNRRKSNSSSVIEVGTVGADGKNVAATNRARTVSSYKTSEKTLIFLNTGRN